MCKYLFLLGTLGLVGCGSDVVEGAPGSGLVVSDSSGIIIGELIMVDNECFIVYQEGIGLFGVSLDTGKPCYTGNRVLEFSGFDCSFNGTVFSGLPLKTSWATLDEEGNVYMPNSEVMEGDVGSKLEKAYKCETYLAINHFKHSSIPATILQATGDKVDLGTPPLVIQ
jgi:hypothetical protein